jgi:hypothetical protein
MVPQHNAARAVPSDVVLHAEQGKPIVLSFTKEYSTLFFVDPIGKMVQRVNISGKKSCSIDRASLGNGIYVLDMTGPGCSYRTKIFCGR